MRGPSAVTIGSAKPTTKNSAAANAVEVKRRSRIKVVSGVAIFAGSVGRGSAGWTTRIPASRLV